MKTSDTVPPPGRRLVSLRTALALAFAAALVGGACAGAIVAWVSHSSHFTYASPASMNLRAARTFNVNAEHVRIVGRDGDFELEHSRRAPTTLLNAYIFGTSQRTPVQIGDDEDHQDVLGLLIGGTYGQKNDLQEWAPGRKVLAAIDSHGRLRLGQVTLSTTVKNGVPYLVALLPDGRRVELRL